MEAQVREEGGSDSQAKRKDRVRGEIREEGMALWDPRAVQMSLEMALADEGGRRTKQRR
jgi:hypothetical protein